MRQGLAVAMELDPVGLHFQRSEFRGEFEIHEMDMSWIRAIRCPDHKVGESRYCPSRPRPAAGIPCGGGTTPSHVPDAPEKRRTCSAAWGQRARTGFACKWASAAAGSTAWRTSTSRSRPCSAVPCRLRADRSGESSAEA